MGGTAEHSVIPARATGERRLVSVLFTDMVGYTATVERLGEEKALHFTRMIYDMLTGVVRAHGGTVRGFAGDSIMAVFGMPEALEDAGLRACCAGLAIHAAFHEAADRIAARFGVRPDMRVGISSGAVVVAAVEGEGAEMTVVGNTVNLASRIQSLAPEGGCLICDNTRRLVEWRVDLRFAGEHLVKGVARPQTLWQLQAINAGATRFDASIARGLSRHIGRDRELALLGELLEQSRSQLRVVDIVAEAGLGKTRLIFEFLRLADDGDVRMVTGHCTAVGQPVPFLPFLEIVRGAFRIDQQDEPGEIAGKLQEGLRRSGLDTPENLGLLMNLLGLQPPEGALDGLDGVLIGLRTRDLLPALMKAQSRVRRLVVVLEDIQWIDGASADIVRALIDGGDFANLLVVHTRRPDFEPDWKGRAAVTTLALNPLTEDDIRILAQTRTGVDALPEPLVRQMIERAGGNPLFGEELLSFLMEQGVLRVEAGEVTFDAKPDDTGIPASMQSLLLARIDQLRPGDRAILQAAAAIGKRFDPGLLSQLVGRDKDIGDALQRLQTMEIIYRDRKSPEYLFKHALLRETLYQSLVAEGRSHLHAAIAEAIEARNAGRLSEVAETLAHHYGQTARTDMAFRYGVVAGAKSLGIFSLGEASQYFAKALALQTMDPDCASPPDFVAFLADYALCLNISLDVKTMIALAEQAAPTLKAVGDSKDHVLFLHHYVSCLVANSRFRDALEAQKALSAMAERLGDPKSRAYAMVSELSVSIYCALLSNAEFSAKRVEIEEAMAGLDDAYLENFYFATIGWNEVTRGRVKDARAAAEQLVAHGAERKDPRALGYGTAMQALIAVVTDDHESALTLADEARRLSRAEFEIAIAESTYVAALVPMQRPGARAAVQRYVEGCEARGYTLFAGVPQTMLGVALAMEGRLGEGLHQIEAVIARREAEGAPVAADWNRLFLSEVYLTILAGEGGASAGTLLRNFGTLAGVMLSGERRIHTLIEQARRNPHFDAEGHYFARGELILGLLCKHRKKKAQAIAHLETARRLVVPTGASPMLTRVEKALAELGA